MRNDTRDTDTDADADTDADNDADTYAHDSRDENEGWGGELFNVNKFSKAV